MTENQQIPLSCMNFLDLAKTRYSVRSYDPRPIEKEKMDYVMECARMAPSAVNFQPWKFFVINTPEMLTAIKAAYPREWIQSAPCIIVACSDHSESWHRRADNKDHADIDIAIAVEHICLAATEQGLGTCWVCNFDPTVCRNVLSLPQNLEPAVLIPIGYPAATAEAAPKKRKEANEIISYL